MVRKGWGVERHCRGNLGEGPDMQVRLGTIAGEGRGGRVGHHRKLPAQEHAHAHRLRGWGGSVEATGSENPLGLFKGD